MYLPIKIALIWSSRKTYTFKRIVNYIKVLLSERLSSILKKPIVWGYPVWTIIEPTNACNLRCPGCITGGGIRNDETDLIKFENYRKVIDDVSEYGMGVLLYFRGEPFLHPKIIDMIKYAKSKNLIVRTGTNANLIDSPEMAEEIVKSGLDWIRIALDGVNQEMYEKYRRGGKLERVKNAIKYLAEAKKKLHRRTPVILVQYILFKHTEPYIDEAERLAFELGADHFFLKTAMVLDENQAKELLPENREYWRYESIEGGLVLKNKFKNRCKRIWTYYNVEVDGSVPPCCFDGLGKYTIGNAFNQSMKEIWKNKKYNEFRRRVLKGRKDIDICRNCTEGVPVYVKKSRG